MRQALTQALRRAAEEAAKASNGRPAKPEYELNRAQRRVAAKQEKERLEREREKEREKSLTTAGKK